MVQIFTPAIFSFRHHLGTKSKIASLCLFAPGLRLIMLWKNTRDCATSGTSNRAWNHGTVVHDQVSWGCVPKKAIRALPLRVGIRSWCSTSANDKWRSTVSGKTRYRKLFTLCALKHFNRAVFGPLKSQRNVDPQTGAIVFLRTTMHHSSDDAVFLHQCLKWSSYFVQFSA